MTLKVLDKIHQLVHDGATVIGPGVTASPSLADYLNGGDKFGELAADLWADLDGITRTRDYYGKGMVVWGESPESVLALKGIPPDVETVPGYGQTLYGVKPASGSGQSPGLGAGPGPGAALSWIHRRTPGAEIYFLANRSPEASEYRVRFRSGPSDVEFWDPSNGSIRPAPYSIGDGFTDVPVRMDAYGSVFVVFRNTAPGPGRELPARKEIQLEELEGPWKVDFHDGPGSPGVVTLKELASWTANAEEKVKYFSGSATYSRTVEVPPGWREPGQELYLDLGEVGDLAEVSLNGKKLATLWKEPYRVSLSGALQKGSNLLEVTVTNEWTNRILGDMNAGKGEKVLNTRVRIFAGGGLPRSGLMGPVRIVAVRVE
jgi:hypothetical protein